MSYVIQWEGDETELVGTVPTDNPDTFLQKVQQYVNEEWDPESLPDLVLSDCKTQVLVVNDGRISDHLFTLTKG